MLKKDFRREMTDISMYNYSLRHIFITHLVEQSFNDESLLRNFISLKYSDVYSMDSFSNNLERIPVYESRRLNSFYI